MKYDRYFRKCTRRYFGAVFDWKWFKAHAIAESNLKHKQELDPDKKNPPLSTPLHSISKKYDFITKTARWNLGNRCHLPG